MPIGLFALTAGAFGIGVTEFVIMGLLLEVSADLGVSLQAAGLLVSGYALGVVVGAPILTIIAAKLPRKTVLVGLMGVFTVGNIACAIAPTYSLVLGARVLTAFAHGTFFGVGSVVAADLVSPNRRASAIAVMFTGLTVATVLGVPFGTWIGQSFGWRATFWVVGAIGAVAMAALALWVRADEPGFTRSDWRKDISVLSRRSVLLGLLTTVLGYSAVFAVFTYIAPLLTRITGFPESAVSPILLVFGGGLVAGNLLGGRLADRHLVPTVLGTLVTLSVVLGIMTFALRSPFWSVVSVGLLGASAFATVPPLQAWVLSRAEGAGQSLASTFNIAAFNLGNAAGAWAGGVIISHGPGLGAVTWIAALIPLCAVAVAASAIRLDRPRMPSAELFSTAATNAPKGEECP
ncbi:MFS transporter [Aquisalimonas lutea]|uniref:MFS transporter n=1 Tax=Aquisalimonas lutea TaxID=1327750 RepID=UPI0025B2F884|nr:MFS transporter [Aquisalimonas lutea]MDN3516590.1 MFS transporter [Aquisalimonas lutea]